MTTAKQLKGSDKVERYLEVHATSVLLDIAALLTCLDISRRRLIKDTASCQYLNVLSSEVLTDLVKTHPTVEICRSSPHLRGMLAEASNKPLRVPTISGHYSCIR